MKSTTLTVKALNCSLAACSCAHGKCSKVIEHFSVSDVNVQGNSTAFECSIKLLKSQ